MKKVFALVLSLVLLLGIAVPGTLAMDADPKAESTAATTEATVPATTAATVETTAPAATTETTAPAGETKSQTAEAVSAAQSTAATTAATEPTTPAATEETKAPETPAHIETCSDTCTTEGCKCPCHLYNKLMACTSCGDMETILASTPEAELMALTEVQTKDVQAHYDSLIPEPTPLPNTTVVESDPPVPSEIVTVTKNFANVAPFVGDEG